MANDAEVSFGIFGETNLDDVAESIERGLQDAAEGSQKAAAGAESMEKAMDSASEAVASLGAASESADDQLEEIEDELEDISVDANTASGSIAALNASLAGIEDIDDDMLNVDTNIDEIQDSWREMRNEIDDFDNRVENVMPPGTMRGDDDATDIIRRVDTDSGLFRRQIAERLGASDDINVGKFSGRLASQLGGEQPVDEVAAALSRRSDTTESFSEALDAVVEAADINEAAESFGEKMAEIDTTPTLPAPDDNTPALPAPDDRTLGLPAPDGPITPDRFNRRFDIPRSARTLRSKGVDLSGQIPAIDRDRIEIPPSGTHPFKSKLSDALQPATQISQRADRAQEQVDSLQKSVDGLNKKWERSNRLVGSFGREVDSANASVDRLAQISNAVRSGERGIGGGIGLIGNQRPDNIEQNRGLRNRLTDLSQAAVQTETTFGFMIAALSTYAGSAKTASRATEELDDEVEDLSRSLAAAIPAVQNLSANLGPFNVSFSNLLATTVSLIAVLGPLVSVMLGIAGAAIAIAGALGSILAVGAIQFTERLQENFAGINNTMQALEAIAKGLQKSIVDALGPLKDIEIGGVGPAGLFVTLLRDIVTLINMFAKAMATLLEMDEVENFLLRMRAAILGFSEETAGGMSIIDGLKSLMEDVLPILGDFLVWLIDVTPEFLEFIGTITREAAPAIAQLGNAFIELSAVLTEFGTGALQLLLPALSLMITTVTTALIVLRSLHDLFGSASDAIIALGAAMAIMSLTIIKSITVLNGVLELMDTVKQTVGAMNDAVNESDTVYEALNKTLANSNSRLLNFLMISTAVVSGVILIVGGLILMLDALGLLNETIALFNAIMGPFVDILTESRDVLDQFGIVGDIATRVIEFFTGALMFATGVSILFNLSIKSGILAMRGYIVSVATAVTSLASYTTTALTTAIAQSSLNAGIFIGIVQTQGLTVAVRSLIASLSTLAIVSGVVLAGALALLVLELMNATDMFGLLGEVALGVIAVISAALLSSGWGALIVALGVALLFAAKHFDLLGAIAIGVIGAITAALVGSGWGAIVVAVGLAILAVIENFDTLKRVAVSAIEAITQPFKDLIGWLDKTISKLGRMLGLWNSAKAAAPIPGVGERGESGGASGIFGQIFGGAATGAVAGGAAGSIIPGAGTAVGAGVGAITGGALGAVDAAFDTGGFVDSGGLAMLHSNEAVVPEHIAQDVFADKGQKPPIGGTGSSGRGDMTVNVNVNNESGNMDDRRAREIAHITKRTMDNRMRREDGR